MPHRFGLKDEHRTSNVQRRMKKQKVNKTGLKDSVFPQPKDRVSDHIRIEERSIALHRAIADRIRTNPRLMEKARENLQKYLEHIIQQGLVQEETLRKRVSMLRVEKAIKDRILKRIGA